MMVDMVNGVEEGRGVILDPTGVKFAELFYIGGKLNGRYAFFNGGKLSEEGNAKNNMRDGICRIKYQEKFGIYEFRQGDAFAEIKEWNPQWRMYTYRILSSETPEMIVQYDNNFRRHGFAIKMNKGLYEKLSEYHQDQHLTDRKKFVYHNNRLNCTEFDDNGNKVYEGECSDDIEFLFPRQGMGNEYSGAGGTVLFDGLFYKNQWYEGKLYNNQGSLIYQGRMWNGMPHREGTVFLNGQPVASGQWVCGCLDLNDMTAVDWNHPTHRINITHLLNSPEYRARQNMFAQNPDPTTLQFRGSISGALKDIRVIRVADNSCNDANFRVINFSEYPNLVEIRVGNQAFQNVKRVFISDLNFLKVIAIGNSSFAPPMRNSVSLDASNPDCHITKCRQLNQIDIGPGSFATFSMLEIKYLPQLQILRIGRQNITNPCFCFVSHFALVNLPKLEEIELGGYSFIRCQTVILSGMPFLKRLFIGDNAMQGDKSTLNSNKIQLYCR